MPNTRPNPSDPTYIRNMQMFLRRKGYNIKVTGRIDRLTREAKLDWEKGPGKRTNPTIWNNVRGLKIVPNPVNQPGAGPGPGAGRPSPQPGHTGGGVGPGTSVPQAPHSTNTPTSGSQGPGPGVGPTIVPPASEDKKNKKNPYARMIGLLNNLMSAGSSVGEMIPMDILSQLDAENNNIVNLTKKIMDNQIAAAKAQSAQNVKDIGNWYGDVNDSFAKALTRSTALNQRVGGEQLAAEQGLLSSIGGSATPAGATVAAAGRAADAGLRQSGLAEEQYLSDVQPLIKAEGVGASARQKALLSQTLAGMNSAYAQSLLEAKSGNLQDKLNLELQIYGNNNNLAQTRYGNQVAGAQNILATLMGLPDIKGKQLANELAQLQLDTGRFQLGQAQNTPTPGTNKFVPWEQLDPSTKDTVLQNVFQIVQTQKGTHPDMTQAQIEQYAINQLIQKYGYNHPQAQAALLSMIRAALGG